MLGLGAGLGGSTLAVAGRGAGLASTAAGCAGVALATAATGAGVGATVGRAEGTQFFLHAPQRIVMFVRRIVALHVGDRTDVAEARQRVDMAVGIVAGQITVAQPEDAVETERLLEERLKLRL